MQQNFIRTESFMDLDRASSFRSCTFLHFIYAKQDLIKKYIIAIRFMLMEMEYVKLLRKIFFEIIYS